MTSNTKEISTFPKVIVMINIIAWIIIFIIYSTVTPSRFVKPIDYVFLACFPLALVNLVSLIVNISKLNKQRGIIRLVLLCIPVLFIITFIST